MRIEVTIYDAFTNRYSLAEWGRVTDIANNALQAGYPVKFDEYQGAPLAWVHFDDEGEAALFKLRYM